MGTVRTLSLRHPGGSTPVVVGAGALAVAASRLGDWVGGRTVFLLSTPLILDLYGDRAREAISAAGRVVTLEVPEGEAAKNLGVATEVWERMIGEGGKRDSRLVSLGGGSVGDLGGFVAGCFLRGIDHVQLPTTLLAQVDAAIGGKTAVDLPQAKNSVGLFCHPSMVVADTTLLASLPRAEIAAGLVEVVKMAVLLDPPLLDRVESDLEQLLEGDAAALAPVVAAGAAAKIGIVEADPHEGGRRRLLNFGHTLGHALEATLGYRGLRHGEAVGYGILFALRLAKRRGIDPQLRGRLAALLGRLDLPPLPRLSTEPLLEVMARDKKARESGQAWILLRGLGEGEIVEEVPLEEIRTELEAFLGNPWGEAPGGGRAAPSHPSDAT